MVVRASNQSFELTTNKNKVISRNQSMINQNVLHKSESKNVAAFFNCPPCCDSDSYQIRADLLYSAGFENFGLQLELGLHMLTCSRLPVELPPCLSDRACNWSISLTANFCESNCAR